MVLTVCLALTLGGRLGSVRPYVPWNARHLVLLRFAFPDLLVSRTRGLCPLVYRLSPKSWRPGSYFPAHTPQKLQRPPAGCFGFGLVKKLLPTQCFNGQNCAVMACLHERVFACFQVRIHEKLRLGSEWLQPGHNLKVKTLVASVFHLQRKHAAGLLRHVRHRQT